MPRGFVGASLLRVVSGFDKEIRLGIVSLPLQLFRHPSQGACAIQLREPANARAAEGFGGREIIPRE